MIRGSAPASRFRLRAVAVIVGVSLTSLGGLIGPSSASAADYSPAGDMNSLYNATRYTGVREWWRAGYTGKGVDVAVIDTGVAPVDGLATPGKILYGPDLSLDSQDPNLRNLDANGHGTFMAGIIAGRGSGAADGSYVGDATNFLGVAPDARIVSIKVGAANGAVDVSQVIAAVDWVVQHRQDNGLNIRVLSLSYGTDSTQDYKVDPLAFALEQAVKAGIFVVAAAGNEGDVHANGTLTDPAYDPRLFAVGASDPNGTFTTADDTVPGFSSSGSSARTVDVVAPGSHLVSLRVPGSYIDQSYGATAAVNADLMRGSGTSEAAAFTAGEAALVLQKRPDLVPSRLDRLLTSNASTLPGVTYLKQGNGLVDMSQVLAKSSTTSIAKGSTDPWSTGIGSLELSRGTQHLVDGGVVLRGDQDIFGQPFNAAAMAALESAQTSWVGGTWNGSTWTGDGWNSGEWLATPWTGHTWSGSTWSASTWSGNTWSGSTWSSSTWSGNTWSSSTWSGSSWSGAAWLGATWR
jgi:serine protease AprX